MVGMAWSQLGANSETGYTGRTGLLPLFHGNLGGDLPAAVRIGKTEPHVASQAPESHQCIYSTTCSTSLRQRWGSAACAYPALARRYLQLLAMCSRTMVNILLLSHMVRACDCGCVYRAVGHRQLALHAACMEDLWLLLCVGLLSKCTTAFTI